jgi:hypothetical protein
VSGFSRTSVGAITPTIARAIELTRVGDHADIAFLELLE